MGGNASPVAGELGDRGEWGLSAVPPAPACRAGSSGGPRGTGPAPRRRATRTSRTASPAPETHRARRWEGGPRSAAVPCPRPPGGRYLGDSQDQRLRPLAEAVPPHAVPPPRLLHGRHRPAAGGHVCRADQSAPSPGVASHGAPRRAACPECRR